MPALSGKPKPGKPRWTPQIRKPRCLMLSSVAAAAVAASDTDTAMAAAAMAAIEINPLFTVITPLLWSQTRD
jgi:hypothetical protein